jgi:TP901 family phage tail tape measure protein
MSRLTATMVVDLTDKTGGKTKAIIGNLDRLKRAERDYMLADKGLRLSNRDRALERLMVERDRTLEERQRQMALWGARAGMALTAAGYVAAGAVKQFASVERQFTRIGITADASAEQTKAAMEEVRRQTMALAMPLEEGVTALDTLVASGQSLDEALAFLPSVLATAQATGAATTDIANSGLKAASALKIPANQLQRMFDVMVTGAKAGQFETRDMAQYIPSLANSFASLGYTGEEGLKRLVAILQTIREDTGDASSAATQAGEIFGKIYAGETMKKFKDFGIDLRKEMDAARKSGEDTIEAFIRLSSKALKGDMSKLPLLFTDKEFRLGMQSLLSSPEALQKFFDTMNSASVDGTVFRDVNKVLADTQSAIDKLTNSASKLLNSGGAAAAPYAVPAMDYVSDSLDFSTAVNAGLEKSGHNGFWSRTGFGLTSSYDEKMAMAIRGGYANKEEIAAYYGRRYERGEIPASTGRHNQRIIAGGLGVSPERAGAPPAPLPASRPDPEAVAAEARRVIETYRRNSPGSLANSPERGAGNDARPHGAALDAAKADQERFNVLASYEAKTQGPQSVTLSGTPTVTLSGTPTVQLANPPPRPNVTMNITINEASDAEAIGRKLGAMLQSEMNGIQTSTNYSGL